MVFKKIEKNFLKYILMFLVLFNSYSEESKKMDVETNEATIDFENEEFTADGGVTFVYPNADPTKTGKIKAYKLKKMTDKNLVEASDGVIFEQGENKVEAEKLYYNLDDQSLIIRNGVSYVKVESAPAGNDKIYYGGEEFFAKYPSEAHVKNAWFTTSSKALKLTSFEDKPEEILPYHLKAKKISVYPEKKLVAYNVFLYAKKVPILWLPWYATSLKSDSKAPLFPVFGSDSDNGSYMIWGLDYGYNSNYFNGSAALKTTGKKGLYIEDWTNVYKVNGNKNNTGTISLSEALILPKGDYEKEYKLEYKHSYTGKYGKISLDYTNQTTNTINDVIDALDDYKNGVSSTYAYEGLETKLQRYELSTDLTGMGKNKDTSLKADIQYANNKQFLQALLEEEYDDDDSVDTQRDNDMKSTLELKKDNFLYGFNLKYDYLDDLDPGSQYADTTSHLSDFTVGFNLKKYGVSFSQEEKTWDTWVALDDDERYLNGYYLNKVSGWAEGYSYVPFSVKKYDQYLNETKIKLGDYKLFNGKMTYSLEFHQKEEEKELNLADDPLRVKAGYTDTQYFRDEDITYEKNTSQSAKLNLNQGNITYSLELGTEEEIYTDRSINDSGITYENTSNYYDTKLRDKKIDFRKLGTLDLTIGQRYDKYERGDNLTNLYTEGVHNIGIYSNSGDYFRKVDLSLDNTSKFSYNVYNWDLGNYDFNNSNGITNVSDKDDLEIYRLSSRKNTLTLGNGITFGVGNTKTTYGIDMTKAYNSLYTGWLQDDILVNSIDFKIDDKRTVFVSYGEDKDYTKNDMNSSSSLYGVFNEKYFLDKETDTIKLTLADDDKEYGWTHVNTVDDEREEDYIYLDSNGDYLKLADTSKTYGDIETTEKSISDTFSFAKTIDDKRTYKLAYTRADTSEYDYTTSSYDSNGIKNKYSVEYTKKDLYSLKFAFQDYKDEVTSLNDERSLEFKYEFKLNKPKKGNESNVKLVDSTGTERFDLTEEELAKIDSKYNEEQRKEKGLGFDLMGLGEEKEEVIYNQYYSIYVNGTRNEDYFKASNNLFDSMESLDITLEAHYKRFKLKYTLDQDFTFATNSSSTYGIKKTESNKEHDFSVLTMIGKDSKSWKIKGEIGVDETLAKDNGLIDSWSISVGKEFDFFSTTLKYEREWNETYDIYDWTWSINFALLTFPEKGVSAGANYENGGLSPEIKTGM